jgi:hypothetical protein
MAHAFFSRNRHSRDGESNRPENKARPAAHGGAVRFDFVISCERITKGFTGESAGNRIPQPDHLAAKGVLVNPSSRGGGRFLPVLPGELLQ